ncbi:MAG TPA: VanW family protein, partial [Candidatus Limnocylindria bacterium]|nr:VanW family protein [Candidatus Limnocylindria bacterium]
VVVDGVDLGGAGMDEAAARMASGEGSDAPRVDVLLQVDDSGFRVTGAEVPFARNTPALLEEAWSIGRQGFAWGIGSGMTPFEIRWRHARQTQAQGAYFQSEVSYDKSAVASLARAIAAQADREPVNAVIQEFNFQTREYKVTRDVPGRRIAAEAIADALTAALDAGQYQASLRLSSEPILPRVTSVDLQNGFTKLASFSTKTDSNEDRNNNIALAARAVSNRTLMPGETFSFNQATGERTPAKGYRGAPAIAGGVLIDDVGGGVCQVSSTLFNAAALSGMTIVSRDPHAWPVSYLDRGLDATVNWPGLDFKFRNDKDTPVFIIAWYENRRMHAEIYGMRTGPGETIALETQTTSTTKPPAEPLMQLNPSLPFNTTRELKQARTGYVVDTWRVYLRGGAEYRREKLFTSNYRMVQQVIEYN